MGSDGGRLGLKEWLCGFLRWISGCGTGHGGRERMLGEAPSPSY